MYVVLVKDEEITKEGARILDSLYEHLSADGDEVSAAELGKTDTYDECLPFFLSLPADVAVTADMAGFRTLSGEKETVFNSMYCKCIHILTREPWYYPNELLRRMNFTGIVVTAEEWEKEYIERFYENVPRVCVAPGLRRGFEEPEQTLEEIKKNWDGLPRAFSVMANKICSRWKTDSILPKEIDRYLKDNKIEATDEERVELNVLLKDIPLYYRLKNGWEKEESAAQSETALTRFIISLIREE